MSIEHRPALPPGPQDILVSESFNLPIQKEQIQPDQDSMLFEFPNPFLGKDTVLLTQNLKPPINEHEIPKFVKGEFTLGPGQVLSRGKPAYLIASPQYQSRWTPKNIWDFGIALGKAFLNPNKTEDLA